jgi:hypothetical protein
MPVNATKRCWQSHPPDPPVPEHVPAPPFGAPSSMVAKEYDERIVGVPYECASEKIVAVMYVLDGELMLSESPFCEILESSRIGGNKTLHAQCHDSRRRHSLCCPRPSLITPKPTLMFSSTPRGLSHTLIL